MKQALFFLAAIHFLSAPFNDEQPDARVTGNLIYSAASRSLFLIDGYTAHPADGKSNVYSWDGKEWKKINASGPDTKSLSSAAFNTKTNEVVVFGGVGSKGYQSLHGDTWVFNGKEWHQMQTNNIGTRDHCKMVYDAHLDAFIMYGGQNETRAFDSSTWILKNGQWKELKSEGPGSRFHFGMAYDPLRDKVVLYGGYNSTGLQQDTWEFDGTAWTHITDKGPGPRGRFSMVYDAGRKMVILYGGDVWKKKADTSADAEEVWDIRNDTWGWDGNTWIKLSGDGPARMLAALGFDASRKKLVLFGGGDEMEKDYADTWEFTNNKWVKVADNGVWKWNGKGYEKLK